MKKPAGKPKQKAKNGHKKTLSMTFLDDDDDADEEGEQEKT